MSAKYGRIAGRRGAKRALLAIGHEILRIVYHILAEGSTYYELGDTYYDAQRKQAQIKHYTEALKQLGVNVPEKGEAAA